jgi:hypothetical protein
MCGFGRMGSFVCQGLNARNMPFVVMEKNLENQARISTNAYLMVGGDATTDAASGGQTFYIRMYDEVLRLRNPSCKSYKFSGADRQFPGPIG